MVATPPAPLPFSVRLSANTSRAGGVLAAKADVGSGGSPEAVRDFLDSRHGRHCADDVASELAKTGPAMLEAATLSRWQGWRIGCATTQRDLGIPAGLSCLTGFIGYFAILDEIAA